MDDSITLFANFDSANMAKYERVWKSSSQNSPNSSTNAQSLNNNTNSNKSNGENNEASETRVPPASFKYDIEFNVWTKPDCEDTEVGPNPNRTWFCFGIKGGHGKYIKFNLMNLNKQGRLFEMGMLPVFKTIPGHEKWSRIYTRPTWQTNENNFLMSFIHRIPDKRDTITYFAFCFPHSYEECQQMLEKYDQKFDHCKYLSPDRTDPDDIYYHRELLCYSLDQRRIDLITISACNLLNFKREPRFDPDYLFPRQHAATNTKADDASNTTNSTTNTTNTTTTNNNNNNNGYNIFSNEENLADKRCYSFDKKKVFVLTSRVHPGETPASFVFNGFFEFILRKDDPRARVLRRQFVFKLVPMLNPDGVARGHYRTDQLGTNLNRVYLDPCFRYHPSIYAIKSLIVFHHINNRISKEHDGLNFDHIFKLEYDDEPVLNNEKDDSQDRPKFKLNSDELNHNSGTYTSATSSSFSPVLDQNLANSDDANFHKSSKVKLTRASKTQSSDKLVDTNAETAAPAPKKTVICNNNLVVENDKNKYHMYSHVTKADTIGESFSRNKALAERISNEWMNCELISQSREEFFKSNKSSPTLQSYFGANNNKTSGKKTEEDLDTLDYNDSIGKKYSVESEDLRIGNENSDDEDPNQPDYALYTGSRNSPHLNDSKLALINPLWSGVAFYIDLHGHAAKRGCFIYGNSIDNELYQVENVLFAKLISISSQHFDFDGCNFSVKNMYMRDKREGLSKEGSGRVAMHKILGIIHSYTLECCYASGRVMNTVVPAINTAISRSGVISPPLHSDIPPKFMPEHYADVGKALAIAALDIIEMNPHTRIPNTSFGSLEAIRNWLKFYIRSKADRSSATGTSSNLSLMQIPISLSQSNAASLKQKNQRFYFQQKLNKLIVNPSKSSTNTLNSVASSSSNSDNNSNNLAKSQQQESQTTQQSQTNQLQQQTVISKSSTNINSLNKLNGKSKADNAKKSLTTPTGDDSNDTTSSSTKTKPKGLPHSVSQGNLLSSSNDTTPSNKLSTKTPDNSQTPVKTSSIGLVDFSTNLLNNPAQVGNTHFSSTRNKIRHSIKTMKDLETTGNNSNTKNTITLLSPTFLLRNNSNNSPINGSSGSSSSNNANSQKLANDSLAAQLRRKLSIPAATNKTDPSLMRLSDIDNLLDSEYYYGSLNKLAAKDKRWLLVKDSEENAPSQLGLTTPVVDELTYQTPEDISAKMNSNLNKVNNFKHLSPLSKSKNKQSNDLNSNVVLFKHLNTNILVKSNQSKVIPINLTNTTNIVSSLRPEVFYKSLEATSSQQKRYFNAIKPKSGKSTTIDLSELGFKGSVLETKNLFDFSDIIKSGNLKIDFNLATSLPGVDTSRKKKNFDAILVTDSKKKYLKTNELITVRDKKKK